jgi:hypothetical protein
MYHKFYFKYDTLVLHGMESYFDNNVIATEFASHLDFRKRRKNPQFIFIPFV